MNDTTATPHSIYRAIHSNVFMVPLLCAYPVIGAAIALYVFAFSDQGRDLLIDFLERCLGGNLAGISRVLDLVVAAWFVAALFIAGLLFWYSARLLLLRDFKYFPLEASAKWWRALFPRLLGTSTLAAVTTGFALLAAQLSARSPALVSAGDDAQLAHAAFVAAIITGVVTILFFGFLVFRRTLLSLAAPDELKHAMDPTSRRIVFVVAISYVLLAAAFCVWPTTVPRFFGAPALVLLGVSMITFVAVFVVVYWPLSSDVPTFTVPALVWLVFCAMLNDNHDMRPVKDWPSASIRLQTPSERLSAWLEARDAKGSNCTLPTSGKVPVVLVAASGGGIRAGYWAARVLEQLASVPGFDCSVFAMSGVSGGTLGLAAHVVAHYGQKGTALAYGVKTPASVILGEDFLSASIGGLLFYDTIQQIIPIPVPVLDRSRGLEESWTTAFAAVDEGAFSRPIQSLYADAPRMPILFLNSTMVENGRRAIHAPIDTSQFVDVEHLLNNGEADASPTTFAISLSSAVHNSARFTYVSPAGRVEHAQLAGDEPAATDHASRLVDGGYFENSGAATISDLWRQLSQAIAADSAPDVLKRLKPILVLIRNQPGTESVCGLLLPGAQPDCISLSAPPRRPAEAAPSRLIPEALSPLQALMNTRSARERLAVAEAAQQVGLAQGAVIEAYIPETGPGHPEPPLGWSMSKAVKNALDSEASSEIADHFKDIARVISYGP